MSFRDDDSIKQKGHDNQTQLTHPEEAANSNDPPILLYDLVVKFPCSKGMKKLSYVSWRSRIRIIEHHEDKQSHL